MAILNIGKDYSVNPSGRYRDDGPSSGTKFREDVLVPMLKSLGAGEKLEVVLDDGVLGYGSSFLSEGFAGVVREGYFRSDELLGLLEFKYSDKEFEFFQDRIEQYVAATRFPEEEKLSATELVE